MKFTHPLETCPGCQTLHNRENDIYLGHNTLQDGKTYAIAKCSNCGLVWGVEVERKNNPPPDLPHDFGFRVPEGIVRSGDSMCHYQDGKRYRVTVRFKINEEF